MANNKKNNKKLRNFAKRVLNIIAWPFRTIGKLLRKLWNFICKINLIGLTNTALLVAIIVLFSILIMDFMGCRKQQTVVVPQTAPVETKTTKVKKTTLPLATDKKTYNKTQQMVRVVSVSKVEIEIVKKQTAIHNKQFWGDVIIDNRSAGALLQNNSQVNGNLYLQNMRKYVLPCNIRINGNLFLRDVNMLQFCGDFVVTGNIYVSPRSAFAPIPRTAKVGGYVVL